MFRNLYDTDCITWSPQGRIFQIEYAMEAVKQGSCSVGLRSDKYVVLCSIRRSVSKLTEHLQKLYKIDDHIGIAMSGITADAKVLSTFMRNECFHHKFVFVSPMPVCRLVAKVADKSQAATQRYSKRPYGVGLLVAGYDESGPHLCETCPSGNFYELHAMAFGSRSQSSKTYLERNFRTFKSCNLENLVFHGIRAIKASLAVDNELTPKSLSIGVVGEDLPWTEYTVDEVASLIEQLEGTSNVAMDIDPITDSPQTTT